ncbi:MAG TPA: hypothetical protein HA367_04310 [Candidatus Methanofastidiosum sp.]|nr:hypothetical protein [Methanofastidiosum sp.]
MKRMSNFVREKVKEHFISFKSFGWGMNVIMSFLTPDKIRDFLKRAGDVEMVLNIENRLIVSRKWKYILLMSDIGRLVVIGRVRRSE